MLLVSYETRRLRIIELKNHCDDDDTRVNVMLEKELDDLEKHPDEHILGISMYNDSDRDRILLLLIFMSIQEDTRARRICYKYNNILEQHRIQVPKPVTIVALRSALPSIMNMYFEGVWAYGDILHALQMQCTVGHIRHVMVHPDGTFHNLICDEHVPEDPLDVRTLRIAHPDTDSDRPICWSED